MATRAQDLLDRMNRNGRALATELVTRWGMPAGPAARLTRSLVAASEMVREVHSRGLSLSEAGIDLIAAEAVAMADG